MSETRIIIPQWAQSVVLLHEAASQRGWSQPELHELLAVHDFILPLYAGWKRASGRCFTAHLIGTAALALEHGAEPVEVKSALAHAVFDDGAFGWSAQPRVRRKAGDALTAAAGADVASMVLAYSRFDWGAFLGRAEQDCDAAVVSSDKRILRMRICNEIDDALDRPFFNETSRAANRRECAGAAAVARVLRLDALSDAVIDVSTRMDQFAPVPGTGEAGAYFVRPHGYRRSLRERAEGKLARLLRR